LTGEMPTGRAMNRRLDALIVLSTLCAEGTPVMALDLCREWRAAGLEAGVITLFDEPDDMQQEFRALGVPIIQLHLPQAGRRRYLAMASRMASACRAARPRAVLSMPFGWHAFVAVGAKSAGVPRVAVHVGSFPPHWQGKSFWKFKAEVLLGRPFTDRLICCSEYVREGVVRYFRLPERSMTVVYNGADISAVAARAARSRASAVPGPFRVGMVARLERSKDHDSLVEAVALVASQRPVELVLVGDGSRRAHLEALARARGVGEQVRFLGTRRDVPEILGSLDAFAFSVKPDEGLGIALIEAMAARVPVVATDVGACREILEGGALGRLVPYRDPAAMAQALEELAAGGPAIYTRLDLAARAAEARFSTHAMAAGYARELGLAAGELGVASGAPS